MGLNFVVSGSTAKNMKSTPLKNFPLYGTNKQKYQGYKFMIILFYDMCCRQWDSFIVIYRFVY